MSEQSDVASVQVIDRAFSVLELVSNEGSMSLKDIYTLLGLNKASAMRIANALVANGYFDKDERGNYSLTFKAYEVGIRAVRRVDYITFIRETLDQLAAELGVIAQFSVKEGTELLCLESFDLTRSNFSVSSKGRTPDSGSGNLCSNRRTEANGDCSSIAERPVVARKTTERNRAVSPIQA